MRQRVYQISTLLSLTAVSFVVIGWITALVRHTEFSRFGTVTGLALAWLFALCHCLTRPITETIHPPRTKIKPILHRVSFVLGLVCITMIPVGLIIRGTERGD
ncbi:hypothetical protein [Schlesneria sp. T3-172]|uniref:hypothetical protein n=1 Tax=Schlesneria sphaerica TaxID=3373610 RepID=UPI0037C6E5BB